MKECRTKHEKGITLIALVITIIVIIILSSVTINIAFGENGLIGQAEKIKELTTNDTQYEEDRLQNLIAAYDEINSSEFEIDINELSNELSELLDD